MDWANLKRIMDQWKSFAPNFLGDFYPLTPYSLKDTDWIAWQFHRADAGKGMVQAFRRSNSVFVTARLPLFALESDARYTVTNIDEPETRMEFSGNELMSDGLPVTMNGKPAAVIYLYEKL